MNDIAALYRLHSTDAVVINRDNHVIDPEIIFPGKTVYLSAR